MDIFLVAPKQRPTFPSNRNNPRCPRALSRRSSRCCNASSSSYVSRASYAKEGGRRRLRPVGAVTADVATWLHISRSLCNACFLERLASTPLVVSCRAPSLCVLRSLDVALSHARPASGAPR